MTNIPETPEEYRAWWAASTNAPYGFCWCGCGLETTKAPNNTQSSKGSVSVVGEPRRYLRGHYGKRSGPDYIVEDRGHQTPCWIWQKLMSPSGYGLIYVPNDNNRRAHRVYYERKYGLIPEGKLIHHKCNQTACVNPDHLTPMTPTEHEQTKRNIKITQNQVSEIKTLYSKGGLRYEDLANLYGVCTGTIYRALRIR